MRRIVSLLPSATEMLFALGAGGDVVAVSDQCDYPPEIATVERVTRSNIDSSQSSRDIDASTREHMEQGRSLYTLNQERIAALQPDLIVTQAQCDVCAVRYADVVQMVQSDPLLAQTQIVSLNPTSLEDVLDDVLQLGVAAQRQEAAKRLAASMRERIDRVATCSSPGVNRPLTVCVEWFEPLMTAGNWIPQLVSLAGGISQLAEAGSPSQYVKWHDLAAADPDVILLMPCGFDLARVEQSLPELKRQAAWKDLRAVRCGKVVAVDSSAYFLRSGPRLVDSLEMLVHILHPVEASQSKIPSHPHGWQVVT